MKKIIKTTFFRLLLLLACLGIALGFSDITQAKVCSSSEINEFQQELTKEKLNNDRLLEIIQCFEAVQHSIEVLQTSQQATTRLNAAYTISLANPDDIQKVLDDLVSVLRKSNREPKVRYWIITALGNAQDSQQNVITALIETLKGDADGENRYAAAWALGELQADPEQTLPVLIEALQVNHPNSQDDVYLNVAEAIAKFGIQSKPHLDTLKQLVQSQNYSSEVRLAIAETIAKIALAMTESVTVKTENILNIWTSSSQLHQVSKELESILQALQASELDARYKEVKRYKELVDGRQRSLVLGTWFARFGGVVAIHGLVWLALIFAYPRSPMVQAAFFWNPRIRKILGFPYITEALKWIPYFRRILFIPFQKALRSDANLDLFTRQVYFADLTVKAEGWQESQPIATIIPQLEGQIVLQGESGSGKSMFLRHLLKQSQRIAVYLPAQKCDQGVIGAIQAKLYGQAQDADFLRDLIYSGAIDIYIDGLNEVTPDTRATIKEFVEKNFKGNIILTTQPLEWKPPGKLYHLQPLKMEQISIFLQQHQPTLPEPPMEKDAGHTAYAQTCADYLQTVQADLQADTIPADEKTALRQILSNPMDLTVVAQLLANQQQPNLLRLREQQYTTMAEDYQQIYLGRAFPLVAFAEMAYQLRLKGQSLIPDTNFVDELLCLERHKMVVCRHKLGDEGKLLREWFFRHEKMADFFVAQSFLLAADDRQLQHFADSRFRGVYLLLATLLPEPQKMALREQLIQYAAKHNDHVLSDAFIQRVGSPQ